MKKTFCDRCGKDVADYVCLLTFSEEDQEGKSQDDSFDLCEDCVGDIAGAIAAAQKRRREDDRAEEHSVSEGE